MIFREIPLHFDRLFLKDVIFVDFEIKKQLEAARKILEDLRESL